MKSLRKELRDLFPKDMRKYNFYGKREKVEYKQLNVNITSKTERGINVLIREGKFPNKSEFVRYLIVRYFDKVIYDE